MSQKRKRAKPDASGDNKRALVAGQRVFDRYYLKRTLGQGGMGAVWLAHDRVLEQSVALKFLAEELFHDHHEVERLKRELEQKGSLMQPDQRQNLEDEYTKKARQFQDDYKNSRDELQQKDNEVTGAIVRDLATVVRNLGEKAGYTMVMEKGQLLWALPAADITDQVIRAYDAMNVKPGSLGEEAERGSGSFGSAATAESAPARDVGGRSTILK